LAVEWQWRWSWRWSYGELRGKMIANEGVENGNR
jgi:hypothetical protein